MAGRGYISTKHASRWQDVVSVSTSRSWELLTFRLSLISDKLPNELVLVQKVWASRLGSRGYYLRTYMFSSVYFVCSVRVFAHYSAMCRTVCFVAADTGTTAQVTIVAGEGSLGTVAFLPLHASCVPPTFFCLIYPVTVQGGPKNGTKFLHTNNFVRYKPIFNFFLTVIIRRKFVVKLSLKILPHLKCVATLPSKISVFLKQHLKTRRYL